jgi:glycosyltransferase involved in cell wall biosynthesis
MLARRPVIATGAGGVPEIVSAGTGVLVPPGDAKALAAGFTRLLTDPEFAAGVARKGRERATTHFTVETMVDRKTSHIEAAIRKQAA